MKVTLAMIAILHKLQELRLTALNAKRSSITSHIAQLLRLNVMTVMSRTMDRKSNAIPAPKSFLLKEKMLNGRNNAMNATFTISRLEKRDDVNNYDL